MFGFLVRRRRSSMISFVLTSKQVHFFPLIAIYNFLSFCRSNSLTNFLDHSSTDSTACLLQEKLGPLFSCCFAIARKLLGRPDWNCYETIVALFRRVKRSAKKETDIIGHNHYLKSVRICRFSGKYFPTFGLST